MKHKRVWHYLNIIGLLLCITVSFAWIKETDEQKIPVGVAPYFQFDKDRGNSHAIAGSQISTYFYYGDDTEHSSSSDDPAGAPCINISNFAPGSREIFVIEIKNKSAEDSVVAMSFSDMSYTGYDGDVSKLRNFFSNFYVGIIGTEGFTDTNKAPVIEDMSLGEEYDNGAVAVFSDVVVPAGNSVKIRFYIRFSSSVGNEYQGKDFKIGKINIVSA